MRNLGGVVDLLRPRTHPMRLRTTRCSAAPDCCTV